MVYCATAQNAVISMGFTAQVLHHASVPGVMRAATHVFKFPRTNESRFRRPSSWCVGGGALSYAASVLYFSITVVSSVGSDSPGEKDGASSIFASSIRLTSPVRTSIM